MSHDDVSDYAYVLLTKRGKINWVTGYHASSMAVLTFVHIGTLHSYGFSGTYSEFITY